MSFASVLAHALHFGGASGKIVVGKTIIAFAICCRAVLATALRTLSNRLSSGLRADTGETLGWLD